MAFDRVKRAPFVHDSVSRNSVTLGGNLRFRPGLGPDDVVELGVVGIAFSQSAESAAGLHHLLGSGQVIKGSFLNADLSLWRRGLCERSCLCAALSEIGELGSHNDGTCQKYSCFLCALCFPFTARDLRKGKKETFLPHTKTTCSLNLQNFAKRGTKGKEGYVWRVLWFSSATSLSLPLGQWLTFLNRSPCSWVAERIASVCLVAPTS